MSDRVSEAVERLRAAATLGDVATPAGLDLCANCKCRPSDLRTVLDALAEARATLAEVNAALGGLSREMGSPCLDFGDSIETAVVRFATERLREYPMKRTWDAEAGLAEAQRERHEAHVRIARLLEALERVMRVTLQHEPMDTTAQQWLADARAELSRPAPKFKKVWLFMTHDKYGRFFVEKDHAEMFALQEFAFTAARTVVPAWLEVSE